MHTLSKIQIIVVIVIIVLVGWLLLLGNDAKPTPTISTPTTTPTDATWPSTMVDTETISESTSQYSIDVAYPVTKDPRITAQFKEFAEGQVAQFKEDTSWANDPSIAPAEAAALSLEIDFTQEKSTYVETYIFSIVTYTGGAHGLQVTRTFAFDSKGKTVQLADLFTNGEAGLTTIAPVVIKDLTKRAISDANWIADGAGPKSQNYQAFIVTDAGITIIFDPYQVAAYSAGPQTVVVPKSVFKGIANPELW
ncbi:MAG: DUF3298 domain-containing protein [Candidatus Pacebacteria bacterium]|nr:DUF3298 domain-containing protein [Candidatus Paceibacterota bacterium]